ncbi:MAG: aspartyl protease [Dehalococcoidia bacterium]|jgi:clan AA aspartic protease
MKTGIVFPGAEGRQRHVGQIRTTITLENRDDLARARYGDISADDIRAVTVSDVLVDTGASILCVPARIIERLGLGFVREVETDTATGPVISRIFGDVRLTVEGRSATFECLEMPGGDAVLLGVIPLETLGLELDLRNQRFILLPDYGPETYISAL